MKKEIIIGSVLCVFALVFLILVVQHYPGNARSINNQSGIQTSSLPLSTATTHSLAELQQHSSPTDCWQAIEGKVYNLTSFIDQHPGGANIIQFCGQDATQAYNSIKKGRVHSNTARELLTNYYLGTLK